jgi:hypothetical protein
MGNKKSPTGQGKGIESGIRQDKGNKFSRQLQIVVTAFELQPSTMLEVSVSTGILRANICRYVAALRNQGRIFLIGKGLCSISKHRAGYYTTDLHDFILTMEAQEND